VRNPPRAHRVVDQHGQPIRFHPRVPLFAGPEMSRSRARTGGTCWSYVGDEARPRVLRGNEIETEHHVRLMWSNYQAVLADPEIKMMLFAWNSLFIAVAAVVLQVLDLVAGGLRLRAPGMELARPGVFRLSRHLDDPRSGDP